MWLSTYLCRPYHHSSIDAAGWERKSVRLKCPFRDSSCGSKERKEKKEKLTAEFPHRSTGLIIRPQSRNGILMHRLELGIVFRLSLQVHLSEHVKGRVFLHVPKAGPPLGFQRTNNLPALLVSA